MALKLNESKSDDTKQYFKTSIRMLSELETKISNAIEGDIIRPNGYSRNLRLQINKFNKNHDTSVICWNDYYKDTTYIEA